MGQVDGGVTETMTFDHARIDELIWTFRATAGDDPRLRAAFEAVSGALRDHIDREETDLFPAFADHDDEMAAVSIEGMRRQHVEILRLLKEMGDCPSGRPDERLEREEEFIQALAAHNEAEEQSIYPWIDGLLGPEEARRLARGGAPEPPSP
jgi:hemerythrin superfamily protein